MYLDTSALVKMYFIEEESASLHKWLARSDEVILVNRFSCLEFVNALNFKAGNKEFSSGIHKKILTHFESDLRNGKLVYKDLDWNLVFSKAEKISNQHTKTFFVRALDIMHIAIALILEVDCFVSYDLRQIRLAKKLKMKVINP
jgi:predicted nucleic acid-binding protein